MTDFSGDTDDTFAAEGRGMVKKFLREVRGVKDGLSAAFAIAHVNEDQAAKIAAGVDPAGQGNGLADVRRSQFVAMMRSFHVKEGG
jgi:hypothetical protein